MRHINNRGFFLLECVVALALMGTLMGLIGHWLQVSRRGVHMYAGQLAAYHESLYVQFVLREDLKQTTSLARVSQDVFMQTPQGVVAYSIEDGILKRRFAGQTIRLNPDKAMVCYALDVQADPMRVRLDMSLGPIVVAKWD